MKIRYNDKYYPYFMFLVVIGILIWGIVTKQFGSGFHLHMLFFSSILLSIIRSLLCYLNNKIYLSLQHLASSLSFYTGMLVFFIANIQRLSQNEFSKLLGKLFNLPPDTAYYLIIFMALLPGLVGLIAGTILEKHKKAIEKMEKEREELEEKLENIESEYWKLSR